MQTDTTVIFSHGKESGPWGSKIQAMAAVAREQGAAVESIDYTGIDDPQVRVDRLLAFIDSLSTPPVLVGSSMGGYVATAVASQRPVRGVFVLAPAYTMLGYPDLPVPNCTLEIVHGWRDDVVPVQNSIRFAERARACLHIVDGDHRLQDNIDTINALLTRFLGCLDG